jgi:flagellar protein FlaG
MGMNVAVLGNGYTPTEPPQDRSTSVHNSPLNVQMNDQGVVISTVQATLPGIQTPQELSKTAAELEKITLAFSKKLKFVIDQKTKEVIVKVIDPETDKVIKELPPEELQRLHVRIKEMIGLLFDEKV